MSKTVDERVVEMRFDNKQFESNVQTSMSTLAKLKQSLNLTGATKGLENVNSAAKNVNMSGLGSAVESVQAKFSALQVIGVTALANITNSAVNAGKRIVSALTIDPIKTGFQEYETQINAVQTILANTQKEKTTVTDVNAALDELNTYADKTIYNFTEMTRNIGTFTAAGVKLDTSVNAIQGIANLAAVSGSTSQQASTAMYQLSQALATGTVKLMDWNSVVNAGMGGQVFQDALRETSKALGTGAEAAIKAKGSFRESLQTGWLTSEVLTETLKKFTTSGATEYVAKYTGLSTEAVKAALDSAEAQYGEADAIEYASKALAEKTGKSQEEIKQALQFAKTAEDAATKVKTLTQLWDTLKEAAQSGWSQTWRLLVGDFEEAKELFTYLSDTIGEMISKSADARNKVVKEFVDLGGRTDLIDSLKNTIEGIGSIIKPIREAFREIFPPITAKQLKSFSEGLKELTSHLKISDETASKIKNTFKGLFSIIDIGVTVIKDIAKGAFTLVSHITGLGSGLLDVGSGIGSFLSNLRDGIKETDIFGKAIDKVVGFLSGAIDKIKEFGSFLKENLKFPEFDGFLGFFQSIGSIAKDIGSGLGTALSSIGSSIIGFLGKIDGAKMMDMLNSGLFAGLLISVRNFVKGLTNPTKEVGNFFETLKETVTGSFEKVCGILDNVRSSLEAYQNNLKAGTLLKIAAAVGILAASLAVLSTIDSDKLSVSLGAIAGLFTELIASMAVLDKINSGVTKPLAGLVGSLSNISKTIQMAGLAVSVLILAGAMKILADLDWAGVEKGLVGIAGIVGILVAAAKLMNSESKTVTKFASQMVILSVAVFALSKVAKSLGSMSWEELGKAGTGLLGIISMLVGAAKIMDSEYKSVTKFSCQMVAMSVAVGSLALVAKLLSSMSWEELGKAGVGLLGAITLLVSTAKIMQKEDKSISKFSGQMILMSAAIGTLALVGKTISSMSWEELGKAGAGILGLVTMLVAAAKIMDSDYGSITKFAGQMLIMSASIAILSTVMKSLGSMSWDGIGKGLTSIGGAIVTLAFGLNAMNGTLAGSAALMVAAGALAILTPVLQSLGSMSLESIITTLTSIAGACLTLGVAAMALSPLIPAILGLAAAFALFGLATAGIGAGLALIGFGLTSIAAAGTAAAASLVASIGIITTGLLELIPTIIGKVGEAITAFCQLIGEVAPQIAEAALQLVSSVLSSLAEHAPEIADSLFTLLIGLMDVLTQRAPELVGSLVSLVVALINGLAEYVPEFIVAGINLVGAILQGIVDAIGPILNEIILPLLGVIQDLIVGIVEAIAPYIQTICDAFTTITQIICDSIVQITNALAPVMPNIQAIAEAISTAVQAICNAFIALVSQISPIINSITMLVQQLGNSISQVLQSVAVVIQTCGNVIAQVLQSIADTINSVFSGIADVITSIGDSIKSVLDGIANIFESIGQAALDAGTGFDRLANGVKKITNLNLADMVTSLAAVAKGIKDISKNSEGLAAVGNGMKEIANSVNISSTAFTAMATGIRTVSTSISSIGSNASSSMALLRSSVTSAASCLKVLSTNAKSAATSLTSSLRAAGTASINGLLSGIQSGQARVVSIMRSIMTAMVNGIRSKAALFRSTGLLLMTQFVAGIMSSKGKVSSAVASTVSGAASKLRGYYSSFHSAGAYLASGFANGISSNSYLAAAKAKAMAQAAETAARNALKINSPSKVFIKIGMGVPEGFAKGIDQFGYYVKDSIGTMASDALTNTKKAIARVADVVNSDIDAQPTIRPVLDLSDVQRGAGTLNNMFDKRIVLGSTARVNAVSAAMNSRNQNGVAEELTSAIDKLRRDLKNTGNTYYTIDGITYDDGSNISNAVQDLMRAARVERRI